MDVSEVMAQLEQFGNEQTKKTYLRHGAREPYFGVKVEDLKKIQKKVKKDYALSNALYKTGNSDAMYLAGLIADPALMTPDDLQCWADGAYWYMISEFTVAWVASESPYGLEKALQWIESGQENIAAAGWATLASMIAIREDADLPLDEFSGLIDRAASTIHQMPNRVKFAMNNFVVSAGGYSIALNAQAEKAAVAMGAVQGEVAGTSCKIQPATEYITKMKARGTLGKRRKSPRC